MRAVVCGMVATYPVGGVAWDYGQYALGLERLGWDVYYLEDTGWESYDPRKGEYGDDYSFGVRFLIRFASETFSNASASLACSFNGRYNPRDRSGTNGVCHL